MGKVYPAGSVCGVGVAHQEGDAADLARQLLKQLRLEPGLVTAPHLARVLGILTAELDLRLQVPANRYSVEKSMASLTGLNSHPDMGAGFGALQDARCLDLGCGGCNLGGGVFAMLLAGARSGVAIDLDPVESFGCVARCLHATLGAALLRTSRPRIPATAQQHVERVISFDWEKLADGDIEGVDFDRLQYVQRPLAEAGIGDASIDILVSSSVFEHLADPGDVIAEMARVVRPGGLCVHAIDGFDHRSYGPTGVDVLEFLREDCGDQLVWGCNRIRPLAFAPMFEEHGFEVRKVYKGARAALTDTQVSALAPQFRDLPREHLQVGRARFCLRRR